MNWYKIASEEDITKIIRDKLGPEISDSLDDSTMESLVAGLKESGINATKKGKQIVSPLENDTLRKIDEYFLNSNPNLIDWLTTVKPGHDISKDFTGGIGTQL